MKKFCRAYWLPLVLLLSTATAVSMPKVGTYWTSISSAGQPITVAQWARLWNMIEGYAITAADITDHSLTTAELDLSDAPASPYSYGYDTILGGVAAFSLCSGVVGKTAPCNVMTDGMAYIEAALYADGGLARYAAGELKINDPVDLTGYLESSSWIYALYMQAATDVFAERNVIAGGYVNTPILYASAVTVGDPTPTAPNSGDTFVWDDLYVHDDLIVDSSIIGRLNIVLYDLTEDNVNFSVTSDGVVTSYERGSDHGGFKTTGSYGTAVAGTGAKDIALRWKRYTGNTGAAITSIDITGTGETMISFSCLFCDTAGGGCVQPNAATNDFETTKNAISEYTGATKTLSFSLGTALDDANDTYSCLVWYE